MTVCKRVSKFFVSLDVFGVNLSLTYLTKDTFGSIVGSIFTIAVYSLLIYKFSLSMKDLILKENLTSEFEEYPVNDDILELKDFEVAVCSPFKLRSNRTDYDELYEISWSKQSEIFNPREERFPLTSEQCKRQVKVENAYLDAKEFCYCLNFDENNYFNITKNSTLLSDVMLSISIVIDYTKIKPEDFKDPQTYNILNRAAIFYPKNYVNKSDYNDLLQNDSVALIESFTPNEDSLINFQADKLQVDIVNDIYTFGLTDPYIEEQLSYRLQTADRKSSKYTSNTNKGSIRLVFKHSGMHQIYSIYSFNLESFLGLFGGYFQVFFVFFGMISTFWNQKALEKSIERKFKKNMNKVGVIVQEIEKCLKTINRTNSKFINVQSRRVDTDSQIVMVFDDFKARKTQSNNKDMDKDNPIPPDNQNSPEKQQKEVEMSSLIKNKEANDNNDNVNNICDNKSDNILVNKDPIPHLNDKNYNKDYYKEMIEDFMSQLDYDKLYRLVKEIKLIKFLIFDPVRLTWLHKLQDIPFSIEKFEEYMIESVVQKDHKESDKDLTNISEEMKNKISSIREFLINSS